MEKKESLSNVLESKVKVSVSHCYQCGKCTAGCVLAQEMDYPPSYIMRLLQTGTPENDRRVLASDAIWFCLNCGNCIARCPKEVDIPVVMDYLREEALRRGVISKEARPVVAFHQAFLQSVKQFGRLYEVGLVLGYKCRTHRWLQDMDIAPAMLQKGKLNLLPERLKDASVLAKIFDKTRKEGER